MATPHSGPSAAAPAEKAVAITEHDTNSFPLTRALYIGTTGNLVVTMADGVDCTFNNVPVGIFPVQCIKLKTASTVADVVAMY